MFFKSRQQEPDAALESPLLQALVNLADHALLITNRDQQIVCANKMARELFGYTEAAVNGLALQQILPDVTDFGSEFDGMLACTARTQQQETVNVRLQRSTLMLDDHPYCLITLQAQTDESVIGNGTLSAILNSANQLVVVFDRKGRICFANQRVQQTVGRPMAALIGRDCTRLQNPGMPPIRHTSLIETVRTREARVLEEYAGGNWFELQYCPIMHTNEQAQVVVFGRDINALKSAEEALNRSMDTSDHASQTKTALLAKLGLDFVTPLNAIKEVIAHLREEHLLPEPPHQANLHQAWRTCEHLLELARDLPNISALEMGALRTPTYSCDIQDVVSDCCEWFKPLAREAGIKLEFRTQPAIPLALTHPLRLRQILHCLLSNAIKFSQRGSQIVVSVHADERNIVCTVSDSGCGIAKAKQKELYRILHRLGRDNGHLSGMGLNMASEYAHAIRAQMDFKSEEGQGAEFWVRIPVSPHPETPNAL